MTLRGLKSDPVREGRVRSTALFDRKLLSEPKSTARPLRLNESAAQAASVGSGADAAPSEEPGRARGQEAHRPPRPPLSVQCYECGETFTKASGVQVYEHSRSVDGKNVIYLCELCREDVEG